MKHTYVLNLPISAEGKKNTLAVLRTFLCQDKNHLVFTPNPEIALRAYGNKTFFNVLKKADLLVPDGIGIVFASLLNKIKLKERVTGIDLVDSLFNSENITVYLLGSKEENVKKAAENLELRYGNVKIAGYHHGYFDKQSEAVILEHIKQSKPQLLLVGLGSPKQEMWIYKNRDLPVKITMGIGGAIDVWAGAVKRAPRIFIKLHLEWLYRLLAEPKRIWRARALPMFVFTVILEKIK